LNIWCFDGRLVRDPELKKVGGEDCANFGVAINNRVKDKQTGEWRDDPIFVDCEAWGKGALFIADHFQKGRAIAVQGEVKEDKWTDKQSGVARKKFKVRTTKVDFPVRDSAASRGEDGGDQGHDQDQEPAAAGSNIPF
jgi:single-strand DNA-binding protein